MYIYICVRVHQSLSLVCVCVCVTSPNGVGGELTQKPERRSALPMATQSQNRTLASNK